MNRRYIGWIWLGSLAISAIVFHFGDRQTRQTVGIIVFFAIGFLSLRDAYTALLKKKMVIYGKYFGRSVIEKARQPGWYWTNVMLFVALGVLAIRLAFGILPFSK